MCKFLSWIEYDNQLLYLEDADLFDGSEYSESYKEKLKDSVSGNDCLGHGAIRAFYGLALNQGVDKEINCFWENNKFPEELKKKLSTAKNFMKHWGRMFQKFFSNEDLRYIICCGTDEYRNLAWAKFIKQSPTNEDLRYIICYGTDEYRNLACTQLMKQSPTNENLRYIICYGTDEYRNLAQKMLDKQQ